MEGSNEVNDGREACIKSFAPRYRKKGKKVKGEVLTEFTQMTGYNRCYGAYLLRHQGRRIWLSPKLVAVGDIRKKAGRERARKYDASAGGNGRRIIGRPRASGGFGISS